MSIDIPNIDQSDARPRENNQFRFVWNVLANYWPWLLAGTVLGMIVAAIISVLTYQVRTQEFGAFADLVVKPSQWEKDILSKVGGDPLFTLSPQKLVENTSVRTLAEEAARAMVQAGIAEGSEFGAIVGDDAVQSKAGELAGRLRLSADKDAQKVRIEAIGCASQEEANQLAEYAARVFMDQTRRMRLQDEEKLHEYYVNRCSTLREELITAQKAVLEYEKNLGFQTMGSLNEDMAAKFKELNELQITKEEVQTRLEELAGRLASTGAELSEALTQPTDQVVDRLFEEMDELLKERLTKSAVYQPTHPDMVELEEQIAEQQQIILETVKALDSGTAGGSNVWKQRQEVYRQQINLRMQLDSLEVREASLRRMLEEIVPQIPELANKNLEYERLVNERERIHEEFSDSREREFSLRTALDNERGQVERYEPVGALVMPHDIAGRRWVNIAIGAILGFILAFSACLMTEYSDTSIRSVEDVTATVNIEVIGTIPKMKFGAPRRFGTSRSMYVSTVDEEQVDACIVTQHDPKSPISEAYRALRTNFQFATIKQRPRTLMVTSAVPGEGKTTTVVNMAVTMADQGMRVLVVDTDLRRPNVHRVLRMERGPGLADVLREGLDLKSVIRPTRIQNLWVVSSGRVPPNPSELIGSDRMAQVMAELSDQFDLVICDAPSVLVVTDPVLLATHVDTCILVCAAGFARRETISRAAKLLQTAQANITGVVLNGLETTRRNYYYYYYYYEEGGRIRRKWRNFY